MMYHILIYQVIVDGKSVNELLTVGVQSRNADYGPNNIKDEIIKKFKSKFPDKPITTVMVSKNFVSHEEYINATPTFQMQFRNV